MRLIAFYLPQFHEIEENNRLWGKGFTEWTNVKKAKPLFEGHIQPVSPLNNNYYNLLDVNVMKWQAEIAKQYGVYGFCFYHYWYNGTQLLEKPVDNFLANNIDIPFCICWANHDWTSSWKLENKHNIYHKVDYDDRNDWDVHFNYLLPFLKDSRYIKNDGKPLFVIYETNETKKLNAMLDYWQVLAKKNGLPGIDFAFQSVYADEVLGFDDSRFAYDIEYQPQYVRELGYIPHVRFKETISYYKKRIFGSKNISISKAISKGEPTIPTIVDYDEVWEKTLSIGPIRKKSIPGAFVRMDTTPRKGNRGFVTQGMTPEKFGHYLERQIINCRERYKKDMIFVFAWNEWAEGGYLEPDSLNGYDVLEQIKGALERTNEFPW